MLSSVILFFTAISILFSKNVNSNNAYTVADNATASPTFSPVGARFISDYPAASVVPVVPTAAPNAVPTELLTLSLAASLSAAPTYAALSNNLPCSISTGELYALYSLYNSTNGTNWKWLPPSAANGAEWKFPATTADPCSNKWQGVNCSSPQLPDNTCFVQSLVLVSYNLKGTLPGSIANLTSLSILNLGINSLSKKIPMEIYSMTSLGFLRLFNNQLTGTLSNSISSVTNLYLLSLGMNSLTGSLPSKLALLTNLTHIYLSFNFFTYSIPSQLSSLTKLQFFQVYSNDLSNSIPSELSAMISLQTLDLSFNKLDRSIPPHLSTLTNLKNFLLPNNAFTNSIPSQLSSLTNLQYFLLSNNKISGTIAFEFGNLVSLQYVYLNNNMIRGSIPSSFSALSNLISLFLPDNSLTNSIPSNMFENFKELQVLDLSNNRLEGPLPSSLLTLRLSLKFFVVSNNLKLEGHPFFFLGFPNIAFVNVSYNRFDYDMSSLRSWRLPCPALNYLDMSNNYLIGSLPDSIGTLFSNLTLLSVSNNALDLAYIPESLCEMKNLSTLLLSGLRNRSSLYSSRVTRIKHFTIPSCLLTLPLLETAHLVSNVLYGTIGEIGPSMVSLSLAGNRLVGTIPNSIQRSSSKLNNLQLALNRLSGTLVDDAFGEMMNNSKIDLYENRISGGIPKSFKKFDDKLNILTGNVFYCNNNKAPSYLVDHDTYSCGSSSIDFYEYVYLGVGIASVAFIVVFSLLIRRRRRARRLGSVSNSGEKSDSLSVEEEKMKIKMEGEEKKSVIRLFIVYFQHRPFPTALFSGLVSLRFMVTCLLVALFMVLFNVGYSAFEENRTSDNNNFDRTYTTIFERYGWKSSFMFVHGALPFFLICLGLSILLFVYLLPFEEMHRSNSYSSKNNFSDCGSDSLENKDSSSSQSTSYWTKCAIFCKKYTSVVISFADSRGKICMIVLQALNIIAVTGVNVAYVLGENENFLHTNAKKVLPIVLSICKIIWANTFVAYMAEYGIRSNLSEHVVFLNYVFASFYLYILVPIVTVYFTDHDCFFYPSGFGRIEPIFETYPSITPNINCIPNSAKLATECIVSLTPFTQVQDITPVWIYGYQCGVRILTNYVPAVLASYTIKGVILPLMKVLILSLPPRFRIWNKMIVRILLLPLTFISLSEDILDKERDRKLRTFNYLSRLVTDLLMLFTYGVVCPFLTFLIVWSIWINEFVDHIQIGSYVYDTIRVFEKEEKSAKALESTLSSISNSTTSEDDGSSAGYADPMFRMQGSKADGMIESTGSNRDTSMNGLPGGVGDDNSRPKSISTFAYARYTSTGAGSRPSSTSSDYYKSRLSKEEKTQNQIEFHVSIWIILTS